MTITEYEIRDLKEKLDGLLLNEGGQDFLIVLNKLLEIIKVLNDR